MNTARCVPFKETLLLIHRMADAAEMAGKMPESLKALENAIVQLLPMVEEAEREWASFRIPLTTTQGELAKANRCSQKTIQRAFQKLGIKPVGRRGKVKVYDYLVAAPSLRRQQDIQLPIAPSWPGKSQLAAPVSGK